MATFPPLQAFFDTFAANRVRIGLALTAVAGILASMLTEALQGDHPRIRLVAWILAAIGAQLISAGQFKSDAYHEERREIRKNIRRRQAARGGASPGSTISDDEGGPR